MRSHLVKLSVRVRWHEMELGNWKELGIVEPQESRTVVTSVAL